MKQVEKDYEQDKKMLSHVREKSNVDVLRGKHEKISKESLVDSCIMKEQHINILQMNIAMKDRQLERIRTLIGGSSEVTIAEDVAAFIGRSGDKTKLKSRVKELEAENTILTRMLRGD